MLEAKDTVRFLPNEYRECADEDGVMRKYKVPIHEPSFKAGIKEVVKWIDENCLGCQSNTPCNKDEYLGFHKDSWQAFKTSKGL